MPPPKIELDDDQRFALMKFRRSVQDVLKPHHSDHFLLRWLRARDWNPEAAEAMLRDSMKWREQWEVDTVLMVNWDPPDVIKKYYPSGMCGVDKDGSPIVVIPFLGIDIYGLLHAVSKSDLIRNTIRMLETYLEISRTSGDHKVVCIIDLDGFSLRQYTWRPAAELVISLIQMYEKNYPEILKTCYIINAPSVFALAFSIVKKFLNEYTISKIKIVKADPKKWQPMLLERINEDQLPKYYGGTLVDPDGDPRCPSKVKWGSKVPKELYTSKDDMNNNEFTTVPIKSGDSLKLDFICADPGCYLKWEFRTDGHDIKFGVKSRDSEGTEKDVIPIHRVDAHQVNEVGLMNCEAPCTYTVIFDNSHSMMRTKKLSYNIQLTNPSSDLDISELPEENTAL